MPPLAPVDLLEAIAVKITAATTLKAAARRAPQTWRNGPDAYVVVTQVTDVAAILRGDGGSLADGMVAQASLFERADDQSSARLVAVIEALDGQTVDGHGRGVVRSWRLVPDPDGDSTQTAIDVAYQAPR